MGKLWKNTLRNRHIFFINIMQKQHNDRIKRPMTFLSLKGRYLGKVKSYAPLAASILAKLATPAVLSRASMTTLKSRKAAVKSAAGI